MSLDWDTYFIDIAKVVSKRSKDPSTQTGTVIVDEKNRPISFGYNGFIAGCDETCMTFERPMKYNLIVHGDMNAILFAKRDLTNCKFYGTHAPCENCLKHILQAGIRYIVYDKLLLGSGTKGNGTGSETDEAVTRMIQSIGSDNLVYKNLNGTDYLEELWGGKSNIPNYKK